MEYQSGENAEEKMSLELICPTKACPVLIQNICRKVPFSSSHCSSSDFPGTSTNPQYINLIIIFALLLYLFYILSLNDDTKWIQISSSLHILGLFWTTKLCLSDLKPMNFNCLVNPIKKKPMNF